MRTCALPTLAEPGPPRGGDIAHRGGGIAHAVSHALGRETQHGGESGSASAPLLAGLPGSAGSRSAQDCCSLPATSRGRRKLWQIPPAYHCSLLGVCLGLDEMRRLAARLGLCTSAQVSDYELHHELVHLAEAADHRGRRLDRYLEEKFAPVIRAFRDHRDEPALRSGWERALEAEGDLGGAYFALLTHPSTGKCLAREALGHVHMLAHVAATALRRARAEVASVQAQLAERERALERERSVRARQTEKLERLARRLAEREREEGFPGEARAKAAAARRDTLPSAGSSPSPGLHAELEAVRVRLEKSEHERRAWRRLYRRSQRRLEALRPDPARAPAGCSPDEGPASSALRPGHEPVSPAIPPDRDAAQRVAAAPDGTREPASECPPPCNLAGRVVAYVGGRGRVVPRLRSLTERCNGRFVHHDGGRQERAGRIEESLAGSDILVVPLDCVSHDASRRLKRCCRRQGKIILWLHTASLSAFENALRRLAPVPGAA